MTKQEARTRLVKHRDRLLGLRSRLGVDLIPYENGIDLGVTNIAIECIENLDILIDYVVNWANQDIICDDLYYYDVVSEESWCERNCKSFNRECVIKWLEYKRGGNR